MCINTKEEAQETKNVLKAQQTKNVLPARLAVEKAERENAQSGHENFGSLSFSHGFAPRLLPMVKFPAGYEAWDEMGARVPELLSSGRIRKYCDEELPLLDGEALPPAYAMRAVLVLGYTAHVYWNLGGIHGVKVLPPALELPWRATSKMLGRETPFLGFYDLFVHNFMYKDSASIPSVPLDIEKCPWGTPQLEADGAADYDPSTVTVTSCRPSFTITGSDEEFVFNNVMTEVHCVGAPMVRLVVEAQEAVLFNDIVTLKQRLISLTELLSHIAYVIFPQDSQVEKGQTYVGGAFWAKIIGAVAIPIFSENVGPGPTTAPFIHLFDSFFGRIKHEHFVGQDVVRLFPTLPGHWKEFFRAIRKGPNVAQFVNDSGDTELKGLFGAALRSFAGNEGFLGRHRLKMYGYLEVVMKLGRTMTIAGFGGQFKDRSWDKIFKELTIGQNERFDIPVGALATKVHKARIVQQPLEDVAASWGGLAHIRIDITGCGIRYRPGSRVGVLWEADDALVHSTLLAFAGGDEGLADELGDTCQVALNDEWRKAIRNRPEYHSATSHDRDSIIPTKLSLRMFLKYADIRPVTRTMLQKAYRACGSSLILQVLQNNLETSLQFPDVVIMMRRAGVSLLDDDQALRAHEILFKAFDSDKTGFIESYELTSACTASGISLDHPDIRGLLNQFKSKQVEIDLQTFTVKLGHLFGPASLCDLVPPADFRVYSVASSPSVSPNEISLYISHVQYDQVSPSASTTPLLAGMHPPEKRHGAASDFLLRKTVCSGLAIQAARELSSSNSRGRISYNEDNMTYLMKRGELSFEQANEIFESFHDLKALGGPGRDIDLMISCIENVMKEIKEKTCSNEVVLFHFEPPRFKLPPASNDAPIIMIAGGTGVAPFRGFWQERAATFKQRNAKAGHRDLLILQMRNRKEMPAFLASELASLVMSGQLDVEVMLSQEDYAPVFTKGGAFLWEPSQGRKGYIDTLIHGPLKEKMATLVRDLGAHLYVCGRGGVARTAIEALDSSLSTIYGEEQDVLQRMLAAERLSLEVFSTHKAPSTDVKYMDLSELCIYNDFVGNRSGASAQKKILMAIEDEVYDVTNFLDLHPGGGDIMNLYAGMDATKAWNGVAHNKQPEVLGMLEMYTTGKKLRQVDQSLGVGPLRFWYTRGWRAFIDSLVEAQNIVCMSYERVWEKQAYTDTEEDVEGQWCLWNGKATYRKKKSVFKGHRFLEIHQRLWLSFFPILLGDELQTIFAGGITQGDHFSRTSGGGRGHSIRWRMSSHALKQRVTADHFKDVKDSADHDACDVFAALLGEDIDAEVEGAESSSDGMLSSRLQAIMEQVRVLDEALFEDMKAGAIVGLVAFEEAANDSRGEIVSDVGNGPKIGAKKIRESIKTYIEGMARLTREAFGPERVAAMTRKLNLPPQEEEQDGSSASLPPIMRGGLHLVNSEELEKDFVKRNLVDNDEAITVKFGEDARAHGLPNKEGKCPFPHGTPTKEGKCPFPH